MRVTDQFWLGCGFVAELGAGWVRGGRGTPKSEGTLRIVLYTTNIEAPAGPVQPAAPARGGFVSLEVPSGPV